VHPNDKVFASLHVGYELRQMAGAALRIDSATDGTTHDALLESTLLHARNLLEFLGVRDRNRGLDISATDFVADWSLDPETRRNLGKRLDAIDKHLAHLSWARVNDMPQRWPYPAIVRDLVNHMRTFHRAMKATGAAYDQGIGDELDRIDQEAPLVWTSETIYSNVDTATSQTTTMISRTEDPLELSDFTDTTTGPSSTRARPRAYGSGARTAARPERDNPPFGTRYLPNGGPYQTTCPDYLK
jgi:hypothetical protein